MHVVASLNPESAAPAEHDVAGAPATLDRMSILDAVLGLVRARAERRAQWLAHVKGSHADAVGQAGRDDPTEEEVWYERTPALFPLNEAVARCERRLLAEDDSAFAALIHLFSLSSAEIELTAACLALELDPGLGTLYASLHEDGGRYVSEPLAARLMGHGRAPMLDEGGPLVRWDIVRTHDSGAGQPALRLDPHISQLLRGRLGLDPVLVGAAQINAPHELPLASWRVEDTARRLRRAFEQGASVRVLVTGARSSGRRTFAAGVVKALGGTAIEIDPTEVEDRDWPLFYLHAQRQALLFGLAIIWYGARAGRRPVPTRGIAPLQFVIGDGDTTLAALPSVIDEQVAIPALTLEQRSELWRRLLPVSRAWKSETFAHVAERYRVHVGDVAAIARRGVTEASEAIELCRKLTRDRLGDLGQLVDCPFVREDLTLPEKLNRALDEFLFEARERSRFWETPAARRLFPRGTGLVGLMTGPPGTGKTMAAQVIAADLALDLFRIDIATSVSKYIGETAKNMKRIFAQAVEMNAVLLFDEADALFTKRTDVRDSHDRYANTDTNYLLQLIEDFEGIILLASNKKQNIDAAFTRRIRYVFEFPRPDAAERLLIWQRLVRELAGADAEHNLAGALKGLAAMVEMSGAQIKLAVLGALFAARQVGERLSLRHLYRGVERELTKEGRNLGLADRERIERAASEPRKDAT